MVSSGRSPTPMMRKVLRISLLVVLFIAMAGIGTYVSLTLIIKGEDTVVVPDLVGKDVLYGLEVLSDLGLNTRVKGTTYHDRIPKNHVIDQDPEPGTTIKRGRDVKIRVSRGPETIVMPNLVGLSLQQSRILLTENGLCQGEQAAISTTELTEGRILAQNPQSGKVVDRKACVDLLVSSGALRQAFKMVNLSGLTLASAVRRLESLQLTVGVIRTVFTDTAPLETVVDQQPLSGHRVVAGTPVNLSISRSATGTDDDRRGRSDEAALFRYTLENGFLKKRVQVKINQPQMSLSLFDDYLSPGQEIWLLIPKNGNPTLLVYVDGQLATTRMLD